MQHTTHIFQIWHNMVATPSKHELVMYTLVAVAVVVVMVVAVAVIRREVLNKLDKSVDEVVFEDATPAFFII